MKRNLSFTKGKTAAAVLSLILILGLALLTTGCAGTTDNAQGNVQDIGTDAAFKAALEHAGLEEADVTVTKSRKDMENGIPVYEFDFHDTSAEYEYEIAGATGDVYTFSREVIKENQGSRPSASSTGTSKPESAASGSAGSGSATSDSAASTYIGADKAKSIALEDAGVKSSDASFTTAKLDRDDGRYVYEIDFYTADREYDYEIDALTGKILDSDSEPLDDWDDDWDD